MCRCSAQPRPCRARRSRPPPAIRRPTTRRRSASAPRSSPTTPFRPKPKGTDVDGNDVHAQRRSTSAAPTSTSPATSLTSSRSASRPTSSARPAPAARSRAATPIRLKYAYAQFNLDDWMARGIVGALRHAADAVDRLHRQRLPLPLPGHRSFEDREGYPVVVRRRRVVPLQLPAATTATSTAASTTARTTTAPRPTIRRPSWSRGTVRPLPTSPMLRGLRVTGFYDADAYVKDGERRRGIVGVDLRASPTSTPASTTCRPTDQTRGGRAEARRPRLLGLGDAEDAEGLRLGRAAALRPPRSRNRSTSTIAASATAPSPASPTGSRARARCRRRCCSTTSRSTTTDFTPVRADERRWALHALVNF